MKLIEEKDLKRLLADSEKLWRLEIGGVDNWSDYSLSLNSGNSFEDWKRNSLDSLVNEYPDYIIDDDNYNFD